MQPIYSLERFVRRFKLDKRFKELSGICFVRENNSLAFVQDEVICVYQMNLNSKNIACSKEFAAGDAEDLVVIGTTCFVLIAGKEPSIYQIENDEGQESKVTRHPLPLSRKLEPEGLCQDTSGDRLLIACKDAEKKHDPVRSIYAFDLTTCTVNPKSPVLQIDFESLQSGKKQFHPAGIAIHPTTNDLYLVGTKQLKMLVCCGSDGAIKTAQSLNRKWFEQPEGIAFSDAGDLYLCSEGRKRKPRIYQFAPATGDRTPAAAE